MTPPLNSIWRRRATKPRSRQAHAARDSLYAVRNRVRACIGLNFAPRVVLRMLK
jgi:hypothetical protein